MPLRAAASLRDRPSSTNARASMRRTCAPSVHLPASARNSALVWSAQVIFNVAPIDPPKQIACSGHRIRFLHHGEFDARVRVHAGWYYSLPDLTGYECHALIHGFSIGNLEVRAPAGVRNWLVCPPGYNPPHRLLLAFHAQGRENV